MTIADRVRERIAALNSNPAEIARRAKLGRTFVSDLLAGKKRSVRGHGLIALAAALECDPNYLTGDQPLPRAGKLERAPLPEPSDGVRVLGVCEAGVWRAPGTLPDLGSLPGAFDMRFAHRKQVAFLVRGSFAASLGISDGMVACGIVPADDDEEIEIDGSPLVVRQTRPGGEAETSLRVIEVGLRGARLVSPDHDPSIPPIPFPPADQVEVLAIVTKAIRMFGRRPA